MAGLGWALAFIIGLGYYCWLDLVLLVVLSLVCVGLVCLLFVCDLWFGFD